MEAMKSAHSSAVHSEMMVSGSRSALLRWPYVVGVCSVEERPSESVGEISESVARTGELVCRLRSYSSSASDSAYAVPESKFIFADDQSSRHTGDAGAQVHTQTPTQTHTHTHTHSLTQADEERERAQTNRETETAVAVLFRPVVLLRLSSVPVPISFCLSPPLSLLLCSLGLVPPQVN